MKPFISIIIPIYNSQKYIKKNIDSILNQTYKNFELLLINDGSTDDSLSVINSYNDDRIRLINKKNGGVSSARNYGINSSSGDYLYFVDSDDYIEPNTLEKFVDIIKSFNPDLIICGFFSETYNSHSYDKIFFDEKLYSSRGEFRKDIVSLYDKHLLYNVWNKLFKKDIIINNNILFPNINFGEDIIFNQLYLENSKKIYNSELCLYHYVREVSNSITTKYIPNLFDLRINENKIFINFFNSYGVDYDSYISFVSKRFIERTVGCLENVHRKNNLNISDKIRETEKIIHHNETSKYLSLYSSDSFKFKFILFFYRFNSPIPTFCIGYILHFFKVNFPNFFNKTKNRR